MRRAAVNVLVNCFPKKDPQDGRGGGADWYRYLSPFDTNSPEVLHYRRFKNKNSDK